MNRSKYTVATPLALLTLWATSVLFIAPQNSFADSVEINVSGRPGTNGRPGQDGAFPAGNGTNGGPSTAGTSAGSINVGLTPGPNGTVNIIGNYNGVMNPSTPGSIRLIARGGDGGAGGNGGDGAQGRTGADGSDATRYSSGDDGDRGGRGGDGGHSTSGSDGGPGGRIVVRVTEENMNLLYLLDRPDVSGGYGGAASTNGSAGPGGRGGDGGDSYSWTTEETYTTTCSETDSEGHSHSHSCTRTRTEYHSNSGGSDGPTGPAGNPGRGSTQSGRNGQNGQYKYIVTYRDGRVVEYAERYELELVGFNSNGEFNQTFLQQGEYVTISQIRIRNTGPMPSPVGLKVRLRPSATNSVVLDEQTHDIDSIAPGETITLPITLRFTVNPYSIQTNNEATSTDIGLTGEILGINRFFPGFENVRRGYQLRSPIHISRYISRSSLASGAENLVRWAISNRSTQDLGGDSRHMRVVLSASTANGLSSNQFIFTPRADTIGPAAPDRAGTYSLERLGARVQRSNDTETDLMRALVGFTEDAQAGGTLNITLRIQIEDPHRAGVFYDAHTMERTITVGQRFEGHTEGADMLLVTNAAVSRRTVTEWQSLARKLGRVMDIWDTAIEGPLDFTKCDLASLYRNGTVVYLNNDMDPGQAVTPADSYLKLAHASSLQTAREHGISIFMADHSASYVIGNGARNGFQGRNIETPMFLAFSALHATDGIDSETTALKLAMADTFSGKLQKFQQLAIRSLQRLSQAELTRVVFALDAVTGAIMQDLIIEQLMAVAHPTSAAANLPLLTHMSRWGLAPKVRARHENHNYAQSMIKLVAAATTMAHMQTRGAPWNQSRTISERSDAIALAFFRRRYVNADAAEERYQAERNRLTAQIESDAEHLENRDTSRTITTGRAMAGYYEDRAAAALLLQPTLTSAYSDDLELLNRVLASRLVPTVQ